MSSPKKQYKRWFENCNKKKLKADWSEKRATMWNYGNNMNFYSKWFMAVCHPCLSFEVTFDHVSFSEISCLLPLATVVRCVVAGSDQII